MNYLLLIHGNEEAFGSVGAEAFAEVPALCEFVEGVGEAGEDVEVEEVAGSALDPRWISTVATSLSSTVTATAAPKLTSPPTSKRRGPGCRNRTRRTWLRPVPTSPATARSHSAPRSTSFPVAS